MTSIPRSPTAQRTTLAVASTFICRVMLLLAASILGATAARADEIRVMSAGAFTPAYLELVPRFERDTHHKTVMIAGATGIGAESIPSRVRAGEPVDVIILSASGIDDLIKEGHIVAGSRVDLVRSDIGMAVRAGAPKPDIHTVEGLKRALLQAKSIAYSAQISGVYLSTELFPRLGVADQIRSKCLRVEREPVGRVVARGDAELGFQQVSELLAVPGIDFVGPLPPAVQRRSTFSAGVATRAASPDAARALIKFLISPEARAVMQASGLEPIASQ
jgi:molybdate transport system substrate-binding protein